MLTAFALAALVLALMTYVVGGMQRRSERPPRLWTLLLVLMVADYFAMSTAILANTPH